MMAAGNGIRLYSQQWQPTEASFPVAPSAVPPFRGYASPLPMESPNRPLIIEEIRTVFISGFPNDLKERELWNLLRWLPGYEASQANFKGDKPMGFALFSSKQHALAAKDVLQDLVFDRNLNSVLHTEMAKKNLFVKMGIVADPIVYDNHKRVKIGGDYSTHASYPSPSPIHPSPTDVWAPQRYMAPTPPPYDPYGGSSRVPSPMQMPVPMPAPGGYVANQMTKDNPPCNTLFIGNLDENINEEELKDLFWMQPGCKQMKLLRQKRNTVCFIEFDDVNSATNVHRNFQGAVVPSSGSLGMHIQYAKNPFGRRKDHNYGAAGAGNYGVRPQMSYQ